MFLKLEKLLLLLLCFSPVSWAKKSIKRNVYCNLAHCGVHNLACRPIKNISSSCSPGSRVINMKPHEQHILNVINTYRNKVAFGYTRTLYPAARMARMAWSKELENFATMYIRKCALETRPCMSSPEFTNIGSVIDGLTIAGVYRPSMAPVLTEELMKGWFEDTRFVTRDMLMHLTSNFKRKSVRQTVLLMTDRNSHVGCSALTFVSGFLNHFRLACAFATDNMSDLPIYKVSSNPGKQCRRRDSTYMNLCALGENYNNNHQYVAGELLQIPEEDIFSI
ncbi:hypothetical protein ACLKA7_011458 [Drosophila subpalustris]